MATTKNLATVPSTELSNAINLLAEVNGEIVRLPYSLIDEKIVPLEEHIDNENNPHKLDTDDIGAATAQEVQELKTEFSEYKISNDAELAQQKSDLIEFLNGETPITGALEIERVYSPIVIVKDTTQGRRGEFMYNANEEVLISNYKNENYRSLLFLRNENNVDGLMQLSRVVNGQWSSYNVLHTGNKPSGSYTGNGSATSRTISTGGIGNLLIIWGSGGAAFVTPKGALIIKNGTISWVDNSQAQYYNGALKLSTTNTVLNDVSTTCNYQCI